MNILEETVQDQAQLFRCEFCLELSDQRNSRFKQIYGESVGSRIVVAQNGLAVMPTIGQLFKGSLLILPTEHIETIAQLPFSTLQGLEIILNDVQKIIGRLGTTVLFEHGAKCTTGASCGIYHAHLHVVPVPTHVACMDVLPSRAKTAGTLIEAFQQLKQSDVYLLFRDTADRVAFLEPDDSDNEIYKSQYFRRALADHFGLTADWDWRTYVRKEPLLLETLNLFGTGYVSHR